MIRVAHQIYTTYGNQKRVIARWMGETVDGQDYIQNLGNDVWLETRHEEVDQIPTGRPTSDVEPRQCAWMPVETIERLIGVASMVKEEGRNFGGIAQIAASELARAEKW